LDASVFNNDLKFVYNIAYKLTQDVRDSEDLAQETLIIAWEKEASLKSEQARYGWLKRICINLFYMKMRRKKDFTEVSIDVIDTHKDSQLRDKTHPLPESELITKEAITMVRDNCFLGMTQYLTLNQRIIFMSVDVFGLSLGEASEIVEISVSAAKAQLYRSRKRLNKFFSEKCQWFESESLCKCEAYLELHDDISRKKKKVIPADDYFELEPYRDDLKIDKTVSKNIKRIYQNLPTSHPGDGWFDTMTSLLNDRFQ